MRVILVAATTLLAACTAGSDGAPTETGGPSFGPTVTQFGALDAPPEHVFGRIEDIAVLPDGHVVVLDAQANLLRRFDAEGRLRAEAGGVGEGPGEFSNPVAVAALDDSTLVVLDGRNKLSFFATLQGDLQHRRDTRVELFGRDLCVLDSRLLVLATHNGFGIHEIDPHGGIANSFHPVQTAFEYDLGEMWQPILIESALMGPLVCLDAEQIVVTASGWLANVTAYSPLGVELWRTTVPDYLAAVPVVKPRKTIDDKSEFSAHD